MTFLAKLGDNSFHGGFQLECTAFFIPESAAQLLGMPNHNHNSGCSDRIDHNRISNITLAR